MVTCNRVNLVIEIIQYEIILCVVLYRMDSCSVSQLVIVFLRRNGEPFVDNIGFYSGLELCGQCRESRRSPSHEN